MGETKEMLRRILCDSPTARWRAPTGTDEKALRARAILFTIGTGVLEMELIDMTGLPGRCFS